MIRDTSLLAYFSIIEELGDRQFLVYEHIKKNPYLTAKEISCNLGFNDANAVKPRITELQKLNLIEAYDKRVCRVTKRKDYVWVVV